MEEGKHCRKLREPGAVAHAPDSRVQEAEKKELPRVQGPSGLQCKFQARQDYTETLPQGEMGWGARREKRLGD